MVIAQPDRVGREARELVPRPAVPAGPYLVVGLGRAGQAAIRALVEAGDPGSVRVWDSSDREETRATRARLAGQGIRVGLGGDGLGLLEGARTVIKSPGVSPDVPVLRAARDRGVGVIDELELGWRRSRQPVVAVTGTNGKSTTASLLVAALDAAGRCPLLVGNTDFGPALSDAASSVAGWLVAEVSSYQAQGSPAFMPEAAILTNLTRDPCLYRHGSMEAYGRAKRRLFVRGDRAVDLAVLNADDPFCRRLALDVADRGGRVITFGSEQPSDYRVARARTRGGASASVEIVTSEHRVSLEVRLPGLHNAVNIAGALALLDGLEMPRGATLPALASASSVPGRFQVVDAGQPFDLVVDFAHSPDSVAQVLRTAREIASPRGGRVIGVMGAIGGSDRRTRELTGIALREGADLVVLCASSVRGEPGLVAMSGLLSGARNAGGTTLELELDRRRAIRRGLAAAAPGDVVVILGRGALTAMTHDARARPFDFDDRAVARELLEEGAWR